MRFRWAASPNELARSDGLDDSRLSSCHRSSYCSKASDRPGVSRWNDGHEQNSDRTRIGRLSRGNRDDVTLVNVESLNGLVLSESNELLLVFFLGVFDSTVDNKKKKKRSAKLSTIPIDQSRGVIEKQSVRLANVDLEASIVSLVKLSNDLGLKDRGEDRVAIF